ncbi:MAG TPA: anthranilate phosphoribosyltransferase [Gammaproteobacteria bacterium]|nr:anthranilate phosphoribosyltransferase [Gammaproteobacteria bacterium]
MTPQQLLNALLEPRDLSAAEMSSAMEAIMQGETTPVQTGGLLVALRAKGETVEELTAAAHVLRGLAEPMLVPREGLIDTCGTGGDASGTFNISTAVAFVAAAAGARVAKHGNRSVSSRSGSADLLEAAGVRLDLDPAQVARCIAELGVGFLYAPRFHQAMRHAAAPRRELGIRTLFNLLGPVVNPAHAPRQLLGVFAPRWCRPLAEVLRNLGTVHAWVVSAADGLDEVSISASTHVAELRNGEIREFTLSPEDLGVVRHPMVSLRAEDAGHSLSIVQGVLAGAAGGPLEVVVANAGVALYVAGVAASLQEGVARAREVIASGAAAERLAALVALTGHLAEASGSA